MEMAGAKSSFVSSDQEVSTPTMSNRAPPSKVPPPLLLESSDSRFIKPRKVRDHGTDTGTRTTSLRRPRFSSTTTAPLIVNRSLLTETTLTGQFMKFQQVNRQQKSEENKEILHRKDQSPLASVNFSFFEIDFFRIFPFVVACDLLKCGVPLKLIQKTLHRLAKSAFRRPVRQNLLKANTAEGKSGSKQRVSHGLTEIRGIPNYGQTCFLNSVLQALASLEPFMAYLERIIQMQDDLPSSGDTSASCFSRQLLDVLEAINGDYSTRRVDPRNLLKRIGQANAQFRSKYMEQQDAQEVLQAILGVIIADAQLDSTSSANHILKFHHFESNDFAGDEETLTAVIAGGEASYSVEWSPSNSVDGLNPLGGDSVLSLSCLLQRIDEGKKNWDQSEIFDSRLKNNRMNHPDGVEADSEDRTHQREEKKQEDFEITIPFTSSEDGLILNGKPGSVEQNCAEDVSSFGEKSVDSLDDSKEGKLSTSMQILKNTISSITPSPLSGWLGSTLRCCDCKHVRPIQNAPFLDIPVVPRSVSKYLERAHSPYSKPVPPHASPLPHCSLDQCLEDFTSVERVSDVECRSCTIQAEISRLEEEATILRGAIDSTERRIKKKGGNFEETKFLREELGDIEIRLLRLKTLDPDDENSSLFENTQIFLDLKEPHKKTLSRCDAKKCLLLTRCPSVLCLHIQRRYFDPSTNRMEKCIQFVEFPRTLDLSPYCAYGPRASTPWAAGSPKQNESRNSAGGTMPYRLQAIIEHRGNAFGGHYVSYRRNHSGDWFRVSDNDVTPIPWRQVQRCQAYMLFYEAV